MSEATLASVYGLDLEDGISKTQFLQLCPALIQQKVGGHCDPPAATTAPPVTAPEATQAQGTFVVTTTYPSTLDSDIRQL